MYELEAFYNVHQEVLKAHYPGLSYSRLLREFSDKPIHSALTPKIREELLKGIPLAYIFKQSFFFDSFFYIDERVLVPRLETEMLVELGLELVKKDSFVVEVGVGCGAISLSLAKASQLPFKIVGTDICDDALCVARKNHFLTSYARSPETEIEFIKGDRLEGVADNIDLIITNPPYIKEEQDLSEVHVQVSEHEPHKALFLPDLAYDLWFTDFFKAAYNKLVKNGYFLMEGHEFHLEKQKDMLLSLGFSEAMVIKDLTNRDRFIKARK